MEQQNNQRSERRSQEQSRNGRGGGNGNGAKGAARGAEKKTRSYKHVQLEHRRPQLSKAGQGQQKQGGQQNARRANFNSPKKDPNATLKIIPLGGLDAIGKNMTVFECKGDMILDDAGLMFPDDDHPGIDLILPDYTYVLENADKLRG
ncbi:MAG: ribonuclease J, partial [Gordonibacter urolithinfaciens]